MITTEGKSHIKRYLAQFVPTIAQSMAFGIGASAESAGNTSLNFEVVRAPINSIYYDFANDNLVYRSTIPEEFIGKIYELGLYTLDADPAASGFGSRLITTFDSATESWVDPTDGVTAAVFTTANSRVGEDSLNFTPTANATTTETIRDITLDLSGNSASDSLLFALNVANANTNAVTVKFMTDASNYYTFSLGATVQSSGYKFVDISKGAASATGAPNWATINEIQVAVQSKASGASAVDFDAIRVEDRDTDNLDYILVARKVLSPSIDVIEGQAQDVEFILDVTL